MGRVGSNLRNAKKRDFLIGNQPKRLSAETGLIFSQNLYDFSKHTFFDTLIFACVARTS